MYKRQISCYLLKLEPGTPWGEAPPERLPDDDRAAGFYLACTDALAARGYAQYEISLSLIHIYAAELFCKENAV